MPTHTLSKSEFMAAFDCSTKLYYRKNGYASINDDDQFMKLLADGGYIIGKMAQLLYPDGIEVEGNTQEALELTAAYLQRDTVTLFEAAIMHENMIARVDILVKNGNVYDVIEVKSASLNSDKHEIKATDSKFRPYLIDLAYQRLVLSRMLPQATINAALCVVDDRAVNTIDDLYNWFSLERAEKGTGFGKAVVQFTGDADRLRNNHLLHTEYVDAELDLLQSEIEKRVKDLSELALHNRRAAPNRMLRCKACEYRIKGDVHDGFHECWGQDAERATILDLAQIGNFNRGGNIDELIAQGAIRMEDAPMDLIAMKYHKRPWFQINQKSETAAPGFSDAVKKWTYPLHFIDFETSAMAVPYHAGMRPYQTVLYQWSCHTIAHEGADVQHAEWINMEDRYPNGEFARTLMHHVGRTGSLLTWSAYEKTQLRAVYQAMLELNIGDAELHDWLRYTVEPSQDEHTMILDMERFLKEHEYFHPAMGGRTSIKVVLPAVLREVQSPRVQSWLSAEGLFERNQQGHIVDPYTRLSQLSSLHPNDTVKDGGGAVRAYQNMLYGEGRSNPTLKSHWRDALLRYCKLDTLAMVIIWERWREM